MSMFPDDDKARKMLPVFKYLSRYFPLAHREVTKVCVVNNVRYNPDRDPADINWARSKSPDQLGSAFRHMMEAAEGKVFEDVPEEAAKATGIKQVYVLAEAMWRIGAELQLTIEKYENKEKQPAAQPGPDPQTWPPPIGSRGKSIVDGTEGVVIAYMKDNPEFALLQVTNKTTLAWHLKHCLEADRPLVVKDTDLGWWVNRANFKRI